MKKIGTTLLNKLSQVLIAFLNNLALIVVCVIYSGFFAASFISKSATTRSSITSFMTSFSFTISVVYLKPLEATVKNFIIKINDAFFKKSKVNPIIIAELMQFLLAAIPAYVLLKKCILDNPNKETIERILTWAAILIFFISRNIKKQLRSH